MWKEIFLNETDEEFDKIVAITNQFSCWSLPKSVVSDSKELLKWQLNQNKYPYRCFSYKDDTFEVLKDFRYVENLDMWEIMRVSIKWDTTDLTIDLMDIMRISILHTKSFMEETGKKVFKQSGFRFNEVTDTIGKWYNPKIIDIYDELDIKVTCLDNGMYWEWELI